MFTTIPFPLSGGEEVEGQRRQVMCPAALLRDRRLQPPCPRESDQPPHHTRAAGELFL